MRENLCNLKGNQMSTLVFRDAEFEVERVGVVVAGNPVWVIDMFPKLDSGDQKTVWIYMLVFAFSNPNPLAYVGTKRSFIQAIKELIPVEAENTCKVAGSIVLSKQIVADCYHLRVILGCDQANPEAERQREKLVKQGYIVQFRVPLGIS
jgi:hypothetical protein